MCCLYNPTTPSHTHTIPPPPDPCQNPHSCYDHKPVEAVIVAENARLEALGFLATQYICYIHCSAACQQFAQATLLLLGPPVAAGYPMEAETVVVNYLVRSDVLWGLRWVKRSECCVKM